MPRSSVSSAGCIQISVSTCRCLYTYSTVLAQKTHSYSHIPQQEVSVQSMEQHLFSLSQRLSFVSVWSSTTLLYTHLHNSKDHTGVLA